MDVGASHPSGHISPRPCGHEACPTPSPPGQGPRLQDHQEIGPKGAVLHAVVQDGDLQLRSVSLHLSKAFGSIAADRDMDVRKGLLKHPRLIADLPPSRRIIGPSKACRGPSVPSAQDGDMVRTKMGREALGKVQGVRRFARAAQFEVAHHEGGKCAFLAAQDAHIIKGVTKVQDQGPDPRQGQPPWSHEGMAMGHPRLTVRHAHGAGKLMGKLYLRVHGERLEGT